MSDSVIERRCVTSNDNDPRVVNLASESDQKFTFDYVAGERTPQSDIFEQVGRRIVDQCLMGYNGSIFAYGQTGSGKTFTIQGGQDGASKGLLPRCFEYLFTEIGQIKNKHMLAKRQSSGMPPARSQQGSAGK